MAKVWVPRSERGRISLKDRLSGGPLPAPEALRIAIAVGTALKRVHEQGRVFGQLDPSQVTLVGMTAVLAQGRSEVSSYTSPEQLQGERPDGRSDIFSLGVLLYHMLSGREPFRSGKPGDLRREILHCDPIPLAGISPSLSHTLRLCLEKRRERRFQRMQILLADLKLQTLQCDPRPPAETAGEAEPALPKPPGPVVVPKQPKPPVVAPVPAEEPPVEAAPPLSLACPRCRATDVRYSRPRGIVERAMTLTGFSLLRCHRCYRRFARLGPIVMERPAD